jgi:hypothetical protein
MATQSIQEAVGITDHISTSVIMPLGINDHLPVWPDFLPQPQVWKTSQSSYDPDDNL